MVTMPIKDVGPMIGHVIATGEEFDFTTLTPPVPTATTVDRNSERINLL